MNIQTHLKSLVETKKMSKNNTQLLFDQTVAQFQVYGKKHVKASSFADATNSATILSGPTTSLNSNQSMASSVSSQNTISSGPNTSSKLALNEYSNLSTNTPVNVLCSIAANPNSVIGANQASTQLNGDESSRPLEQWLQGNERIAQIKLDSCLHRNFATNLMLEFFSNSELTNPNCNVRGRLSNGSEKNKENMVRLDATKLLNIKTKVLGYVEGSGAVKEAIWKSCVTAMNQKMSWLKKLKILSNNNNIA